MAKIGKVYFFDGYLMNNCIFVAMKTQHCIYLGLGSNLRNRKQFLERAIVMIYRRIGEISATSNIYETSSWGFQAPAFYNICIEVKTQLSVLQCWEKITEIEQILGKLARKKSEEYQSRTIDIDILFYNDEEIKLDNLTIPHPQIPFRNFVLAPLSEIAPNFTHPSKKLTIKELLKNCSDKETAIQLSEKPLIPCPINFENKYNYIAIEGNIGAGKTTLATKISEEFLGKLMLERYEENPFLAKFYTDPTRYGFALEMSFLTDRYSQASEQLVQLDLFKKFIISDYDIFKSLIFARVTLNEEEFSLYRKIFYIMYKEIRKPDLYVYLIQNSDRLLKNIEKRGRNYEQSIPKTYLDDIQASYLNFLQKNTMMNVLFIDISELDFVENQDDYFYILSLINQYK